MRQSCCCYTLCLFLLFNLVVADYAPFFDPNGESPQQIEVNTDLVRELNDLKAQAHQNRHLLQRARDADLYEPGNRSADGGGRHNFKGGLVGKAGEGNGGKAAALGKFKKKGVEEGGGGDNGDDGEDGSPCICHYDENDYASGDMPPCNCDGDETIKSTLNFVLMRDEFGTSATSRDEFGISDVMAMNGRVYDLKYTSTSIEKGDEAIGLFNVLCTVTSDMYSEFLCTYEIHLKTHGQHGLGGIVASGPVSGAEQKAIITGAEFDFAPYSGGSLVTLQDDESPLLYAILHLK